MTRAARVYDFTIPAGGAVTVLAEGSFYRLMTAAGALEVRRNNGSIVGPLLPGQGERAEFISLTLTDKSGATNPGSILIGDDTFIDDRISGEVSVIDGGYALSIADKSFSGAATSGAGAGVYSHVQLWNPPASGKNAVVGAVTMCSYSGTANFEVRSATVQAATLWYSAQSKRFGGAASAMEIRAEQSAAVIGSATLLARVACTSNSAFSLVPVHPFVLEPGYGLIVVPNLVNIAVMVGFDYSEVSR